MSLCGIDALTFGVSDLAETRRFLVDWGLTQRSDGEDHLVFETQDAGEIHARPLSSDALPPAFEPGSTLREVTWGTQNEAELRQTLQSLRDWPTTVDAQGTVRCVDPGGLALAFRVSRRRAVSIAPLVMNAPGHPARIDTRAPIYEQAQPISIGHIVLFAGDLPAMRDFYVGRLGFVLSDQYPGSGLFLRCQPRGGHHNLFLLSRPGRSGLNHVAYTVRDVHEVVGGGIAMSRKQWPTEIGPGRHPISSAFFWYFRSPCGGLAEYYADEDYCTESWQPRDYERKPEIFAEWAIDGGIDATTRRQLKATHE